MVKIRLARYGSKKRPVYRVVVCDERAPRDGRFIERVGWFDPRMKTEGALKMDLERIQYWIGTGAQPSDKVRSLIERARKGAEASAA
ncbi:MAG: 30S ribosomal protein S16 [Myxococcales bacterium]|nr:30S ribosomal protein S16 [Myxococcales bacterium]MCB9644949.1 30S ribosomal protein S16 [Myxococcales bacterium]